MVRSQTLIPSAGVTRDLGMVFGGAAVTALAAQVTIPLEPVPFTLQTFAVMVLGLSLGMRRAVASQVLYLAAGGIGLPIFATHLGGPAILFGKTGGYLVSFLVVSAVLGWAADRGYEKKFLPCALALATGMLLNLGLGTVWLGVWIGIPAAVFAGFVPFVAVEALKGVVAATLLPSLRRFV